MNGQTGEFIGDIPIDKKKVIYYFLGIGAAIFAVLCIIAYFVLFVGGA